MLRNTIAGLWTVAPSWLQKHFPVGSSAGWAQPSSFLRAAQRAVFLDMGQTPVGNDFYVHYLYPKWRWHGAPPIRHGAGTTLSMADGHAEYWKWKSRETVSIPRELYPVSSGTYLEIFKGDDYEPQTEDGLYDLQRLQRATRGQIGVSSRARPVACEMACHCMSRQMNFDTDFGSMS
ncbi:MAG: hypothetical protein ACYTE3_09420 [Planctomycetota bacterium]